MSMGWVMVSRCWWTQKPVRLSDPRRKWARLVHHWSAVFHQTGSVLSKIDLIKILAKHILPLILMLLRAVYQIALCTGQTRPAVWTQRAYPAQIKIQHYKICVKMHTLTLTTTSGHHMSTSSHWTGIMTNGVLARSRMKAIVHREQHICIDRGFTETTAVYL
jgi:hypothetical protein